MKKIHMYIPYKTEIMGICFVLVGEVPEILLLIFYKMMMCMRLNYCDKAFIDEL